MAGDGAAGREGPIFIVEDNEDHRDLLGIVLRRAGYRVAYARDGQDAIHRLESGLRPAVIVLDLAMPRMDGLELRARLLDDQRFRGIPMIVVSAIKGSPKLRGDLGVRWLEKPVEIDAILTAVAACCGRPM